MFLLLVISFPAMAVIFLYLGSRFFGVRGGTILACFSSFISCICAIYFFYSSISSAQQYTLLLTTWIDSGLLFCNWGFMFDTLTIVMLFIVTVISLFVHLYSSEYLLHDPHLLRFMSYLSLFTFFMLILVTADNFLQMFVGWEGVGFCSYLLINFWFTRLQANKAAIKAMLVNRVSDFALVLGLLYLFMNFKSIEYASVFALVPNHLDYMCSFWGYPVRSLDIIGIFLFLGAMGKSAQIFLHTWLPDAMEGPTPVSALIHAATMVTAGVFLVTRCSPIFEVSEFVLNFIIIIGSMTAFFASTVGLVQNDLKKVIAYSTCSQLGYMMFACGASNYSIGVFHLFNHAFFKALLFLSAGSVIHALGDEQDMRKMGGLRRILPFTYSMFVIGSLSLMGFPFLTGFYSKDPILEVAYGTFTKTGHFAYWLGTVSAFCTAFYSTRLIYLTFLVRSNSFKKIIINAHDAPIRMALPLALLALGSIFFGYIARDMFIGLGSNFWFNSIFVLPEHLNLIDSEFLPIYIKIGPVVYSIIGLILASLLYQFNLKLLYLFKISNFGYMCYNFLNRKWFFDKIYHEVITQNILQFSYNETYCKVDKGVFELLGPTGIINTIFSASLLFSKNHTGYIYNSSIIIVVNMILFLLFIQGI